MVIKIDVEGQELEVLKGAKRFFDDGRVKAVYLDGFAKQEDVINFFKEYNFLLLDARDLNPTDGRIFSLLAVSKEKININ